MDEIRVTYTGLISLVLGICSIVIGLGFSIIITRNLSEIEYGTWGIIGGLIVYATIIDPVITFWTTREIARNEESGKTAVFTGIVFSSIGLVIYFISAIILSYSTDVDQGVVFLGIILVPLMITNNILAAITLGWKPQGFSFGRIVLGVVQIPLGVLFVMMLNMGTAGVIYAVAIATLASIFYFIAYNKKKLRNSIQRKFIKKWIKFSWVSLYPNIGGAIRSLDVMVFSIITGSVIGIAFWTATQIILSVTASSQLVSTATYSKLLQGGDKEFIKENVRLLIYFTILFAGITITFAEHGLFLLNPMYANAAIIVIIMSISDFLWIISNKLLNFVQGVDKVDMNKESTVQDYFKSSLINIPTIQLIHSIVYISSLAIILLITFSSSNSNLEMLIYWAILAVILEIPIVIYAIFIFHKKIHLKNDYRYILKYTFASVISFGGVYIIMKDIIEFNTKIIEFLPQVLVFVIISVLIYIGITYAIDNKTRLLVKSITEGVKK
jgi:O-antigen/teichoic acid export membrane protein